MSDDRPTTVLKHTIVDQTDYPFTHYPVLHDGRGAKACVFESFSANGPHVWLKTSSDGQMVFVHLDADTAWKLADQLRHAVRNHYQGDATPEWAREENA